MSGGGGRSFESKSSGALRKEFKQISQKISKEEFEVQLAVKNNKLLSKYNDRDTEKIKGYLENILSKLEKNIGTLDVLYGGSVQKNTYVDGLSDVDALLLLNETNLKKKKPYQILKHVENMLKRRMGSEVSNIYSGKLAVTVEFKDGTQIQLLPALRVGEKFKIGNISGKDWSRIDPQSFRDTLTKSNEECGGKLIPTIKLAKAINAQLPEDQRLSGYHLETLAVKAFKNYKGQRDVTTMLPHFFKNAANLVKKPLEDETGQSNHVDDYLGTFKSGARKKMNHILNNVANRLKNAQRTKSETKWFDLFGEE